jgi:cytochrome P450
MEFDRASRLGPRAWPLVGHLPFLVLGMLKARGNFAELVRQMVTEYGRKTLYLRVGSKTVVISADPRFARRVLVDHAPHFPKTGWEKRVLTPTMDDGLIILEGAEWKHHRAAVAPCFSASLLQGLGRIAAGATSDRLAGWLGSVAIGHEIRCITSDVLTRFFLEDHRLSNAGPISLDEYARSFARVEEGLEARVFDPIGIVDRVRGRARGQSGFSDSVARITEVIEERVSRAAAESPPRKSALDLMLGQLPEQTVCREIRTMTAAGATTVHLLTWLCHLLGAHQEVQRKLRRELNSRMDEGVELISTLEGCAYLNAVIHEGLRLYPPAPYLLRQAAPTVATESDPDLPPPSSLVLISIWAMHRHRDFWESPDEFVPERWLEMRDRGAESVEAFMPFGKGPRVCIGRRFALIEAMIILSEIVRRFEIRPVRGSLPRPKLTILTRPARDIAIEVQPIRPPRPRPRPSMLEDSGSSASIGQSS